MILIHMTINPDHNPLISSIWCQVHPGQGGHNAGDAQHEDDQHKLLHTCQFIRSHMNTSITIALRLSRTNIVLFTAG